MTIALLIVIYLVFISLGLPDSIISSAWPSISESLKVEASYQGILSPCISIMTIISAFFSPYLIKKFTTKYVVLFSILLTCLGLIGASFIPNFWLFLLIAIPLGLGGGAIDSALNNYVALHYKALHMNWLHSFWGVGAFVSPLILSSFLESDINGWRVAIRILALIQISIFLITLFTLPLWKKSEIIFEKREKIVEQKEEDKKADITLKQTFKIRALFPALFAFFSYIAIESLTGFWFSSMITYGFVDSNGNSLVPYDLATEWTTYFYVGISAGRFIAGLLSLKFNEKTMIRIGESVLFIGVILMMMQFEIYLMPISLVLIGLGCAPIYPAIIKSTPIRFSKKYSQNIMGLEMAFAYIANFTIAPLFGPIANVTTFLILPYVVFGFLIILILGNEITNYKIKKVPEIVLN